MYKILIRKHQYLSISNRYHTKDFVITMKPQKKYFVSCVNIYLKFKINYELNAICNKTGLFSQNRLFITRNHSRFFFLVLHISTLMIFSLPSLNYIEMEDHRSQDLKITKIEVTARSRICYQYLMEKPSAPAFVYVLIGINSMC